MVFSVWQLLRGTSWYPHCSSYIGSHVFLAVLARAAKSQQEIKSYMESAYG
jgi:hypothetical protein